MCLCHPANGSQGRKEANFKTCCMEIWRNYMWLNTHSKSEVSYLSGEKNNKMKWRPYLILELQLKDRIGKKHWGAVLGQVVIPKYSPLWRGHHWWEQESPAQPVTMQDPTSASDGHFTTQAQGQQPSCAASHPEPDGNISHLCNNFKAERAESTWAFQDLILLFQEAWDHSPFPFTGRRWAGGTCKVHRCQPPWVSAATGAALKPLHIALKLVSPTYPLPQHNSLLPASLEMEIAGFPEAKTSQVREMGCLHCGWYIHIGAVQGVVHSRRIKKQQQQQQQIWFNCIPFLFCIFFKYCCWEDVSVLLQKPSLRIPMPIWWHLHKSQLILLRLPAGLLLGWSSRWAAAAKGK